jgi:hypothetical protein
MAGFALRETDFAFNQFVRPGRPVLLFAKWTSRKTNLCVVSKSGGVVVNVPLGSHYSPLVLCY